jgi:hypothetical protein
MPVRKVTIPNTEGMNGSREKVSTASTLLPTVTASWVISVVGEAVLAIHWWLLFKNQACSISIQAKPLISPDQRNKRRRASQRKK